MTSCNAFFRVTWTSIGLTASLSSAEKGKNCMVQGRESTVHGEAHSTMLNKLLLHRQEQICQGILMLKHTVLAIHISRCFRQIAFHRWLDTIFISLSTMAPWIMNLWCMMPCQSKKLPSSFLLNDPTETLYFSATVATSRWRIVIYFGGHIRNNRLCYLW